MAYARYAQDCDVYVYADTRGGFTCERCPKISETFRCATAADMVTHLLSEHRARGHRVPDETIAELRAETEVDEAIVAEFWSHDRKRKVEVVRRDDGLFQIWLYREVRGEGEHEPATYWSPVGRDAILADSLDRARGLAEEELRRL